MERKIISLLAIAFVITESVLCKSINIEQMEDPSNKPPTEENKIRESEKCDISEMLIHQINDNERNVSKIENKKLLEILRYITNCRIKSYDLTENEACVDFRSNQLASTRNVVFSTNVSERTKEVTQKHGFILRREKRSGLFHLAGSKDKCDGSLIISHDSNNDILFDDFSQLRLKGRRFPMLKPLRNREIFSIEVDGNCSWKLFSLPGYRGRSTVITSDTHNLEFHPKSAMKLQ